jgi:hypothetical protein
MLTAQQQRSRQDQQQAIQDNLGQQTLDMMRRFGSRSALSGSSMTAPMARIAGTGY